MHIAGTKWVRIFQPIIFFKNFFISSYINKVQLPFNQGLGLNENDQNDTLV
jgi:hypothetical protein